MRRADSLEKTMLCWEGLGAGGEGDDRGWDGWMASPTQWTWVWVNSRSWWWTVSPGVMQFKGSQRVGHDWATELNWLNIQEVNKSKSTRERWGWRAEPASIHHKWAEGKSTDRLQEASSGEAWAGRRSLRSVVFNEFQGSTMSDISLEIASCSLLLFYPPNLTFFQNKCL